VQFGSDGEREVVLIADHSADSFVAMGEVLGMYFLPNKGHGSPSSTVDMVPVLLTTVTNPEVVLPVPICDESGAVICNTLGEAYEKKIPMPWMERESIFSNEFGYAEGIFLAEVMRYTIFRF
jgi:hypothetical protein